MPLFARSYQELMADSIEDLATNTRLTRLSAGGKARAILEAVNERIEEQYDIFDLNLARAFVSAAPGQYLELIGALLGVYKESAVAASVDGTLQTLKWYVESGTFGNINNSTDIFIPNGTIISTRAGTTGILYKTTGDVLLSSSGSSQYFSAEALAPGEDSNVGTGLLAYHSFTNYTDYLNNTLLVKNINPIANGKNFESDDNFRFRIANRVLEAEAGNETAIRLAALTTPGVADIILLPRYRGIGTFGVIIQSITPTVSDSLIDNTIANIEKVKTMGDIAYVRGPKETGISLRTSIWYSSKLPTEEIDDIEDELRDTIRNYINNLNIGEKFLVNRMVSGLFGVSEYLSNFGITGTPIEELYIHKESDVADNKIRQRLLADYSPKSDERVIIEPSITDPIVFVRKYTTSI